MGQLELLASLRDSLIEALEETRTIERIGGFVFLRHASLRLVWINQTIPSGPCTDEDLRELLQRYRETDREPFFEFSPELSPEVPPMLEKTGLVLHKSMPVLVLPRDRWQPRSYEHLAKIPTPSELLPALRAVCQAFGGSEPEPGSDERLEQSMRSGSALVAAGFQGGEIVSTGQAIGTSKVREFAGIGTLLAFRRQGFAGAVIDCLLDQFFNADGEIAWLTPGDEGAESLYRKLGFEKAGSQVCYGVA